MGSVGPAPYFAIFGAKPVRFGFAAIRAQNLDPQLLREPAFQLELGAHGIALEVHCSRRLE